MYPVRMSRDTKREYVFSGYGNSKNSNHPANPHNVVRAFAVYTDISIDTKESPDKH